MGDFQRAKLIWLWKKRRRDLWTYIAVDSVPKINQCICIGARLLRALQLGCSSVVTEPVSCRHFAVTLLGAATGDAVLLVSQINRKWNRLCPITQP